MKPIPTPKKLTRRDAIKILGAAAGASVLANLPSQWSTPELTSGVLPAHAQTSAGLYAIDHCAHSLTLFNPPFTVIAYAGGAAEIYILPAVLGVSMHYKIEIIPSVGTAGVNSEGDVLTNIVGPFGYASVYAEATGQTYVGGKSQGIIRVTWTFTNDPADGTGSCISETAYDLDEPTPP